MSGRIDFDFNFSLNADPQAKPIEPGDPMRILLLGDFSAQHYDVMGKAKPALSERPILKVDIDNFDDVLARINPRLQLTPDASQGLSIDLTFKELDDFHPDELYENLDIFSALRKQRDRLTDPHQFGTIMEELLADSPMPTTTDNTVLSENTGSAIDRLLKQSIAHLVVPDHGPQQTEMIQCAEVLLSDQMRAILHEPRFQSLEATWRSLHWLINRVETDESLSVHILDISKQEMAQMLVAEPGSDTIAVENSELYRQIVEKHAGSAGGIPWAMIIGDYEFNASTEDMLLLAAMGAIASQAGGPFIGGANSGLYGCQDILEQTDARSWQALPEPLQPLWHGLRESPMAAWIGLTAPRFLLRQPYGAASDEIDTFSFEEVVNPRQAGEFLWANGAYAACQLLAEDFMRDGWQMTPIANGEVDDLPCFSYKQGADTQLLPVSQGGLSQHACDALLDHGIMPLASPRDQTALRLPRIQSIEKNTGDLAGAWS